jgi:hypothetical protein
MYLNLTLVKLIILIVRLFIGSGFSQHPHIYGVIYNFYGVICNFSDRRATSYMANVVGTCNWRAANVMGTSKWWILAAFVGTCNWRAANVMGTSKWWILAASILDSILTAGPGQLDTADVVGISSWRVIDAMGTSG